MDERELVDLTDSLTAGLVPMAPDAVDVCPVCRAGKGPRSETCRSCRTTLNQVDYPCQVVVPISYYIKPEEDDPPSSFREAMHGYKEAEMTAVRDEFSLVVGGVLVRYLLEHGDALAFQFGDWDAIVTVPSTRTPPPSALARILQDEFANLLDPPVDWLGPGTEEMSWNRASIHGFHPTEDVDGANVLLVDDTFTTGARMQSAAHVLQAAGANVVVGMTVSRKIRVSASYNTIDLWSRQSMMPFSFTDPPWWAAY